MAKRLVYSLNTYIIPVLILTSIFVNFVMAIVLQFFFIQKGRVDVSLLNYLDQLPIVIAHLLRITGFYGILNRKKWGFGLVIAGLLLDTIVSWPLFWSNLTVKWLVIDIILLAPGFYFFRQFSTPSQKQSSNH